MKKTRAIPAVLAGLILLTTVACYFLSNPRGPLKFSPSVLPSARVGLPYEMTATISGNATPAGSFSISEGTLPPGILLQRVPGKDAVRIFGTPEAAGTYEFTIFVWCYGTNVRGQTADMKYTIVVQ